MARNIYKKIASYLKDDFYVLLTSAFYGEAGKMEGDMKKIVHAKDTGCEYYSPVKAHMDNLTTTYEPMNPTVVLYKPVQTGLDRNIIDSLAEEMGEVVVITLMDAPQEEQQLVGAKMYVRKNGNVVGNLVHQKLTQMAVLEAKMCFGTEGYQYKTMIDEGSGFVYKVLLEDMLFS